MSTGHSGAGLRRSRAQAWLVAAGLGVCLLAGPAWAQAPQGVDSRGEAPKIVETALRKAMVMVVRRQIAALWRDDAAAAFEMASPSIQRRFETPEAFMAMVRRDYAPVYRPRVVTFLELDTVGGPPLLRVALIGPDGGRWQATYIMKRNALGQWRIDGCTLIRLPGSTV